MKRFAALALLGASVALAQGTATPAAQLRLQSNVVLVPALVRNAQGEVVYSLKAEDFRITDDGVEQNLTLDEDTDGEALALVVLVETGGAGGRKLKEYKHLGAVIDAVVGGVQHRVAVVGFDSAPSSFQDFTADDGAVGAALGELSPGDKGAAILDGLGFSVDLLRRQPAVYRRAILLISETMDHGSQTQMEEALRVIGDTNTAIYSLGFSSTKADMRHEASQAFRSDKPGPAKGCMATDPNSDDQASNRAVRAFDCLSLLAPPLRFAKMAAMASADSMKRNVPETVAQLTGGEYFKFEDSRSLVRGLMTISNHVPNRYVLSFHPQRPHPGYHAIALRLKDRPGLRITARSSYWVDGEAEGEAIPVR